jgi:hypothetical protein
MTDSTVHSGSDSSIDAKGESLAVASRTATTSIGRKRNAKAARSWLWNYFKLVKDGNGDPKIICQECARTKTIATLSSKTGTSSLSRHLLVKHRVTKGSKCGDILQTVIGRDED